MLDILYKFIYIYFCLITSNICFSQFYFVSFYSTGSYVMYMYVGVTETPLLQKPSVVLWLVGNGSALSAIVVPCFDLTVNSKIFRPPLTLSNV